MARRTVGPVWVTKWIFTEGIRRFETAIVKKYDYLQVDFGTQKIHVEAKHCHLRLVDARTQAEQMRKDRIASLKKQLRKLEGMSF